MRVQIAFQGGGARVAALLAASSAIRSLHDGGTIEVTRVAGTSAGAVAAVLFAAGVDLEVVRKELLKLGDAHLAGLFPKQSFWKRAWTVSRGKPLYDVGQLWELLRQFIEAERTLSELSVPTLVTVADVASGAKRVLSGETTALTAMIDSSALPFVFRDCLSEIPKSGPVAGDLFFSVQNPFIEAARRVLRQTPFWRQSQCYRREGRMGDGGVSCTRKPRRRPTFFHESAR